TGRRWTGRSEVGSMAPAKGRSRGRGQPRSPRFARGTLQPLRRPGSRRARSVSSHHFPVVPRAAEAEVVRRVGGAQRATERDAHEARVVSLVGGVDGAATTEGEPLLVAASARV